MITLSMNEASLAHMEKNVASLSPCHIQNSHQPTVFWACSFLRQGRGARLAALFLHPLWIVAIHVLDLFSSRAMYRSMSRASSHALKHPPVAAPSEPAGATPFPELAVAIERERRRGRGAQSNDSGRFEAEARVAFDDGWQSLDDLPPFKTTVSVDTSRKVIARNDSPDIGFDRSINPYRACWKKSGCPCRPFPR
jgi:hypothetical protein